MVHIWDLPLIFWTLNGLLQLHLLSLASHSTHSSSLRPKPLLLSSWYYYHPCWLSQSPGVFNAGNSTGFSFTIGFLASLMCSEPYQMVPSFRLSPWPHFSPKGFHGDWCYTFTKGIFWALIMPSLSCFLTLHHGFKTLYMGDFYTLPCVAC